jgi:hypothetical protein
LSVHQQLFVHLQELVSFYCLMLGKLEHNTSRFWYFFKTPVRKLPPWKKQKFCPATRRNPSKAFQVYISQIPPISRNKLRNMRIFLGGNS